MAERPLTIWDREKYFDATFTSDERSILREKLMNVCGYDADFGLIAFEYDIERPAEKEVWPVFIAEGLTLERDQDVLETYALIHVARQLRIDYKGYAKNLPKRPIDGFVRLAKETFREFTRPRNTIELKIHQRKLWGLWCEWREMENERTGCGIDSDFFAKYDWRRGTAVSERGAVLREVGTIIALPMAENMRMKTTS